METVKGANMSRFWLLLIIVTLTSLPGCASLLHELQPHRMHRINRNPPPSTDPEFTSLPPSVTTGSQLG